MEKFRGDFHTIPFYTSVGVSPHRRIHSIWAVDTRTFPVLIYDPRKGEKIAQRLSLQGNPSEKLDFFIEPKTNEVYDFIRFARSEGRFSKHFDKDGNPSATLLKAKQERLENWRTLQELAGII